MSNGDTRVDIASEGKNHLRLAIELALAYHSGDRLSKMTHWIVHDGAIYFAWGEGAGSAPLQPLPTPMSNPEALADMVNGWLLEQPYPPAPDLDGSTARGWRLTSHWQLMPDHPSRFYLQFGVRPYWMEYHK